MNQQTRLPSEAMPIPQPTAGEIDGTTLELLATWRQEDATQNPEEVRAAEQELAEFKKAMNENRADAGEPILYP